MTSKTYFCQKREISNWQYTKHIMTI